MRKRHKLNQQLLRCNSEARKNKLMREATEIEKLKMSVIKPTMKKNIKYFFS